MASITQTISSYAGGISQQPDELKLPGQVKTAVNVLPDITDGCLKRPGSKLVASLSDNATATLNSTADGRWFHYYRDETEQYIGQIPRSDGDVKMWRCSDGAAMTIAAQGISGITVDTAGSGYTNAPLIAITNTETSASGSGASAVGTVVNGEITDITITAPGKNYSEGATIYVHGNKGGWAIGVAYVTGDQVTNNDYLYTLTSGNHTSSAGAPTHTSGSVHSGGGTWEYAGVVAEATATTYAGTLSTLKTYLTHSDDQDIQTLTLNDFTYIVNRTKETAMEDTIKPLRPPEAFIELKKVAYASQYPLNVYDNLDIRDVTTATRVSVERVVDSANSCSSNAMPGSGTLPGTGSYTGFCGGGSTSSHEDGYCPNVATKIFAVTPGQPWESTTDSNGVSSTYSFYRDGAEVGGTEVQEKIITLVANTTYTFAANNSATNITVSTGDNPKIQDFVDAIKATNTYQDANYPLSIKVEEGSETAQVMEQQTFAWPWSSGYWQSWESNHKNFLAGGQRLYRGSYLMVKSAYGVAHGFKQTPGYSNWPATLDSDGSPGSNIILTYKEVTSGGTATFNSSYSTEVTSTLTRASSSVTGKLVVTFKTTGDKDAATLTPSGGSAITFTESNSVSPLLDDAPKHLYFRLSTTGQAVPQGSSTSPVYRCRYTTTIDLLYGGTGWKANDYLYVWMKNAKYKITINEDSTSKVQANLGLIRPVPTSFDSKTTVTPESVIGSIRGELVSANDGNTFKTDEVQQIGNGLYLTRPEIDPGTGQTYGKFNVSTSLTELMNVVSDGVQDIADLPLECKDGYVVKIRNSQATEDDYYVEFVGQNGRDGKGSWEECAKPGRQINLDKTTMPIQLVRQADSTFQLAQVDWDECQVGDDVTVPVPSFIGKTINKMVFFRNRLVMLSDENVIMSRPGDFFNFWPKSAITFSHSDVIDLSCSSEFPAIVYDGIQVNAGLALFTKNQQFMLTTDSDVLSPETAKINTLSSYNFNHKTNPISMGTTIAFLDNAGNHSRFWEMARVLREGEPDVIDQSKIVSNYFDKDLVKISNSRENGLIFFSKKNDNTLYGFRYLSTSDKRLQQAWFTWNFSGAVQHHAILDDALYVIIRDSGKDTMQKLSIKRDTDTTTVTDDLDTVATADDITYDIHLDNSKVIPAADVMYASDGRSKIFLPDGFNIPRPSTDDKYRKLVVYCHQADSTSSSSQTVQDSDLIGSYAETIYQGPDSDGKYMVAWDGDWTGHDIILGYLFEMEVDFPTFYKTQVGQDSAKADIHGSLVVHRVKINFGANGVYTTTITRTGKPTYTETWEPSPADSYRSNQVAITKQSTKSIPIYEKNTNVDFKLTSSHPSPATLYSLTWEGEYTNHFYNRV